MNKILEITYPARLHQMLWSDYGKKSIEEGVAIKFMQMKFVFRFSQSIVEMLQEQPYLKAAVQEAKEDKEAKEEYPKSYITL